MATVARLDVLFGANITGLAKGLGRGGKLVGGFASKVGMASKRLLGFGSAIVALGAGAGFTAMVKGQMAAIDKTAKLSDQLGVGTAALQKLRHAADLTGAGAASLDAGLATMSKRLGETARGTGAAKAALEELGLSAQKLIAMTPDEQFTAIAQALTKIEEPARRNAIAANLFSKANMGLLNTLALGKKGLAEAGAEAVRLGMAYSRDMARGVEAANDALGNIRKAMTGFFTRAAIDMAPFIKMWSDDLLNGLVATKNEMGAIGQMVGWIADFADTISDSFKAAQAAVTGWAAALSRAVAQVYELQTRIPYFGKDYKDMAGVAEAFANDLTRSAKAQERLALAAIAAEKPSARAARIMKEMAQDAAKVQDNMSKIGGGAIESNLSKLRGSLLGRMFADLRLGALKQIETTLLKLQTPRPAGGDISAPYAGRGTAQAQSAIQRARRQESMAGDMKRHLALQERIERHLGDIRLLQKEVELAVADL